MGITAFGRFFYGDTKLLNGIVENGMFLSEESLRSLTGYKRPAEQRRWLTSHGWAFEVRVDGKNRVLTEEARNRMLTGNSSQRLNQRSSEPDLAALRNLG